MSPDLLLSLARIVGSVLLLAGVLAGASRLGRLAGLHPELTRKLIHVSLGLYCLTFPWIFSRAWEVAAVCLLSALVFLVARRRPELGEGLHGVGRVSYGELLFAASVALLFYLKDGHYVLELNGLQTEPQLVLYVLPLLMLTLGDAASALVGVNYGRMRFPVEDGVKSVEGVVTFILTGWLASLIALLLLTDLGRGDVILLALITALFGALFEAASWRGLDNLFIPIGLYFILANLLPRGTGELLTATLLFAAGSLLLIGLGTRFGLSRHVTASGLCLLFCIAVFAGPLAVLTPCAAFAAYYVIWREGGRREVAHDALDMIAVVLALALAIFVLSALLRADTIFAFNLAFACLGAGVLARFSRLSPVWLASGIAWICVVALVRVVAAPVWTLGSFLFAGGAICLVIVAAGLAWLLRRWPDRPWVKLGMMSFALGLAGLPLSPHAWPQMGLSG